MLRVIAAAIKKAIAFFKKKSNIDKIEIKLIDTRSVHAGHKLFQYNWIERKLEVVELKRDLITGRKRVDMKKNCVYVSSATKKAAIKKLNAKGFKLKFIA